MPSIGGRGGSPMGDTGNFGGLGVLASPPTGRVGVASVGFGAGNQGHDSMEGVGDSDGFYGGWEQFGRDFPYGVGETQGAGRANDSFSSKAVNAIVNSTFPTFAMNAILYGGSSLFGDKGVTFSDIAQGDPNPNFGTGVSGPDGYGGVGGGPGGPGQIESYPMSQGSPSRGPAQRSPFRVNPQQVQNDMRPWGDYQAPQMNPFSMYGSQVSFPIGQYINTFGGK